MKRTPLSRKTPLQANGELVRSAMKKRRKKEPAGVVARRRWIASLPCLVCGRRPSEPHHVKARGMGGKRPEWFEVANLVPLCSSHHRLGPDAVERIGRARFEDAHDLDLTLEALDLESRWASR